MIIDVYAVLHRSRLYGDYMLNRITIFIRQLLRKHSKAFRYLFYIHVFIELFGYILSFVYFIYLLFIY